MTAISLSPSEVASIFMNGAALMMLVSFYLTTAIYRERKRYDDRMFFYMILTSGVIAVSDLVGYVVDGHQFPGGRVIAAASNTILLYGLTVFAVMFIILVHYRLYRQEERTKKLAGLIIKIEAVLLLVYLLNLPFGYLFRINEENVFCYEGAYMVHWIGIYAAPIVTCLFVLLNKKNNPAAKHIPAGMILFLQIPCLVANFALNDLSVYAVIEVITLCYLHMAILNEEFYAKGGDAACS